MNTRFEVRSSLSRSGTLTLRVQGDLDAAAAGHLTRIVTGCIGDVRACVVNLSRCGFVDSAGVKQLLQCRRLLDGELSVVGAVPAVERVLTITGLDEVMAIQPAAESLAMTASAG